MVTDFGCLGGALMIAMVFFCSSSSVLYYILSHKITASFLLRGKQGRESRDGLERPPRFPWQRSGVAPAQSGVFPASKLNVAHCATCTLPITLRHPLGDADGDGDGYVCLSRTRHRTEKSLPKVPLSPWKKHTARITEPEGGSDPTNFFGRLEAQKMGSLPPVLVFFPR
jgi:hypothetical protein